MKEKIKEIASRVRELRELSELSCEEMAEYLGIEVGKYKEYEEGVLDIPASVLIEIAQKFKVDTGLLLTGEETRMHIFSVTRKGKGVSVERHKQYRYESLADKFVHKKAEPLIVTVEPKSQKPELNKHPGQEFEYVLEGKLKVYIHNNEIVLEEGDSIFFDSSYDHAIEALEGKPAKLLVVVM